MLRTGATFFGVLIATVIISLAVIPLVGSLTLETERPSLGQQVNLLEGVLVVAGPPLLLVEHVDDALVSHFGYASLQRPARRLHRQILVEGVGRRPPVHHCTTTEAQGDHRQDRQHP